MSTRSGSGERDTMARFLADGVTRPRSR